MSEDWKEYQAAAGIQVPADGLAPGAWARARVALFYRLLRRPVPASLAEMMPRAFWPPERLAAYQRDRLVSLLRHAARETPYYREALADLPVDLDSAPTREILAALPVLTREMLRERKDDLLADSKRDEPLRREGSGGSTGEPVAHWIDEREHIIKGARERRSFAFQGLLLGERLLRIWGAPADLRARGGRKGRVADRLLRSQRWFDAYRLGDERARECADLIRRWRPQGILGYAMAVHEVARWLLRQGETVPAPRVVIATAERLFEDARAEIAQAFRCPVLDNYGCREAGVTAWECRERGGMHIDADQVLVEILREGKPVPPGEDGQIVVTALESYAMPLIRYEVGDVGRLLPESCSCGITLPRMAVSVGRSFEILVAPDGRLVHGLLLAPHNINVPGISQIQVEQVAVDHLIVRVVGDLDNALPDLEREVTGNVHRTMGPEVRVEYQSVDSIPVSPTGKRAYVFSRVPADLRQGQHIEA